MIGPTVKQTYDVRTYDLDLWLWTYDGTGPMIKTYDIKPMMGPMTDDFDDLPPAAIVARQLQTSNFTFKIGRASALEGTEAPRPSFQVEVAHWISKFNFQGEAWSRIFTLDFQI